MGGEKMSWYIDHVVKPFLGKKEYKSIVRNNDIDSRLFNSLPEFKNFWEVESYIHQNFLYTGDPLWGIDDYYLHPEYVQFCIDTDQKDRIPVDCDDYACYAYMGLQSIGCQGVQMLNLITNPLYLWDLKMCHVICKFEYFWNGNWWVGIIDTNPGIRWFLKNNTWENKVRETFGNMYKIEYKYLIPVQYPFRRV